MKKKNTSKKDGKVLLIISLVVILFMGVHAMGGNKGSVEKAPSKKQAVQKNQFESFKVKNVDVMNGSGTDKIGIRGFVQTDIEKLEQVNLKDLKEYADKTIEGKDYKWFSVLLKDGTGFCFISSSPEIVSYGVMDDEGRVDGEKKPHYEIKVIKEQNTYELVKE